MKILSLFDGMACGYIAMQNAGVEIESYDAYEIDKYAIQTATHNFPQIVEHGDVFNADFTQYAGVDCLIGGSPCTHWSIAQTQNRETTVSRDEKGQILLHSSGIGFELFSQYLRALDEAKPKYFIYENNKSMSKKYVPPLQNASDLNRSVSTLHWYQRRIGRDSTGSESETLTARIPRFMSSSRKTVESC